MLYRLSYISLVRTPQVRSPSYLELISNWRRSIQFATQTRPIEAGRPSESFPAQSLPKPNPQGAASAASAIHFRAGPLSPDTFACKIRPSDISGSALKRFALLLRSPDSGSLRNSPQIVIPRLSRAASSNHEWPRSGACLDGKSAVRRAPKWCTGEDSNLRSSKERQIYSLLPLTARPPVHNRVPGVTPPASLSKFLAKISPRPSHAVPILSSSASANLLLPGSGQKTRGKVRSRSRGVDSSRIGSTSPHSPHFREGRAFSCSKMAALWSWRRDSNPRPSDYKSDALPAELRQPNNSAPEPEAEAQKSSFTARLRKQSLSQ